ncbi:tyrosine-type recombinase/integrase [Oscillochloris sp. ZM17-4]|uniref:tyrosine-type recombinase/integrase n=1 Tax=Oscillochloris sp. ZM17-4 TaxID=2866714 RepID=UPI001C731E9B|nr:tyrosine-type recombinase/integrase [Oscillochloris sp. ZM17-4]MBX0326579.1 tyrosine-type recombinase/integrase [Oscillochloris sp. ZM17-4]
MAELANLVSPWLSDLGSRDRSPRTVTRYRAAVSRFLAWYEAEERRPLDLGDVTPIALQGYRRALQKTAATSTVNIHTCALRAWCGWLTAQGHLDTNPATHLRLVRTTAPDAPSGLSDTAVNALLREAQRSRHPARDYALVQVMLQTGIRIGECAALCWRDITFGEKSGSLLVRAGKGNKARTVPLNGSARTALASYVGPILEVELTLRAVAQAWPQLQGAHASEHVWRSQMGKHLTDSGIWRVITGLVRNCAARGLVPAETTPHDLRHTFAQHYLDEHPGDLVALARLLGHSSLDTTAIYTQPTADELADRVENLPLNAYDTLRRS